MEEFMLHRRYSKFKNRKIKRRSMMSNECDDDAVTFKVKRFIKDIEKYSVLKEKKKARKEAKVLENNLITAANKGIYKNAVFSRHAIKGLLSGSTIARLEGDLISLSNRKSTLNKDIIKISDVGGNNKSKETNHDTNENNGENSIGNQLLNSVIFGGNNNEENDNLADKETVSVHNDNVDAEIVEIRSNDINNQNSRNSQDIVENRESDYGFIADIPPIVDNLRNMSQNANDEVIFPIAPSVNGEEFFDLLNKTPKNRNSQAFNLFNSPENNQWKEDLINEKKNNTNSFNSVGVQTSLKPIQLPEEYIFKFQPENNIINKEKLLKKDKQIEVNFDEFDLAFIGFDRKHNYNPRRMHRNYENYNFNEKFIDNDYLNSSEILKNRKIIHSPIMKDTLHNFSSSSSIDSINIEKALRNHDFSLNDIGKFNKENLDFTETKFNKYLPQIRSKDDYNFKRKLLAKDESNIKQRYPRLLPNSRFKTSLKFSPHKYC